MKSSAMNDKLLLQDYIETNLQYTNNLFAIPTSNVVENRPIRRKIIETAYKTMLTNMQGNNYIKNDFLNEYVHIIFRESYLKASNNAVRTWQSTYAILNLYDLIKYAKPTIIKHNSNKIKLGFQTNNHYINLYKFIYNFKNHTIPYLNFPIEIIWGRKTTGMLVQYSIEYKKTASKSMP